VEAFEQVFCGRCREVPAIFLDFSIHALAGRSARDLEDRSFSLRVTHGRVRGDLKDRNGSAYCRSGKISVNVAGLLFPALTTTRTSALLFVRLRRDGLLVGWTFGHMAWELLILP